ncbi:hypothetical protein [Streptomyces sp. NPDC005438]|uniref:hypothetical protein n=1 Tax=Streptomyces sp. NPDC005438 TaxID=3156880 RepID=UPI0033BD3EBD
MADQNSSDSKSSERVPFAGTRAQNDVEERTKKVSSEILDLIPVKGKTTDTGPRATPCENRDRERHFRMTHTWSLTPPEQDRPQLKEVMAHLKRTLSKDGWEIRSYGRDSSPNQNLGLVADHDGRGFSVNVVHYAKDDPPKLTVRVISACYRVPKGEKVSPY